MKVLAFKAPQVTPIQKAANTNKAAASGLVKREEGGRRKVQLGRVQSSTLGPGAKGLNLINNQVGRVILSSIRH